MIKTRHVSRRRIKHKQQPASVWPGNTETPSHNTRSCNCVYGWVSQWSTFLIASSSSSSSAAAAAAVLSDILWWVRITTQAMHYTLITHALTSWLYHFSSCIVQPKLESLNRILHMMAKEPKGAPICSLIKLRQRFCRRLYRLKIDHPSSHYNLYTVVQ